MRQNEMMVAIIGTGARSVAYTQLCLSDIRNNVVVKALVDLEKEKMQQYAEKYFSKGNMPNQYTDYNEMLEKENIDAVFICTPDTTHVNIAIACLKKDKHIFLEKPLATTFEDCEAIYRESLKHDRAFCMGFELRYTSIYSKIKEIVSSGALGQIISVEAKEILGHLHAGSFFRRWHRFSKNNGGFLNAKCSHDMDILNWIIADEPAYLSAFGGRSFFNPKKDAGRRCDDCGLNHNCRYFYKPEDYGDFNCVEDVCVFNCDKDIVDHESLIIEYRNGVTASFTVSMFGDRATRTMVIFGTEATLFADLSGLSIMIGNTFTHDEVSYKFNIASSGHGGGDEGIYINFIDSIRSGRKEKINDARAGKLSSAMAIAAEISMKEKKVIDLRNIFLKGCL